MAAGQPLRGFVAQGMDGRKASPTAYTYTFPPGTYTWVAPVGAVWRFVLWGGGGGSETSGNTGGGSGALYIAERLISGGQSVSAVVGVGGANSTNGTASSVTLPSGEVLTAGAGRSDGTAGEVTANRNLDIVFPGSAGGVANGAGAAGLGGAGGAGGAGGGASGGAGAPGYGTYRGGAGQPSSIVKDAQVPGGGKAVNGATFNPGFGGDGLLIIQRVT